MIGSVTTSILGWVALGFATGIWRGWVWAYGTGDSAETTGPPEGSCSAQSLSVIARDGL